MNNNVFNSHSQHADDYIAWQLLGSKNKGLVIEVGAFDGKHLSNSFSLEEIGWSSICIEPNPKIFSFLQKNRPKSTNINVAIVSDENVKEISFFSEKLGVLSGCNYDEEDIKKRYKNRGVQYEDPEEIKVAAKTLNKVASELNLNQKSIEIISIDVEGFEMQVLEGFNLNTYQPGLFVIEANDEGNEREIKDFFLKYRNYFFLGNNFQNLFFIRKDLLSKKIIRNLDFKNFTAVKQQHPIIDEFTLNSVKPNFRKSKACLKYEKYLGLF